MSRCFSLLLLLVWCGPCAAEGSFEERIQAARGRLVNAAMQEVLARPADEEPQIRLLVLQGNWALNDNVPTTPFLADRVCECAIATVALDPPNAQASTRAHAAVDSLDELAPESARVALHRLRLLLVETLDRPLFWRRATELVRDATRRSDQESPARSVLLGLHDWMRKTEPDVFALACLEINMPDEAPRTLRKLAKLAWGASMAPGPADEDLRALVRALRVLAEVRSQHARTGTEFLAARTTLAKALEAEALLAWRAGDDDELREVSEVYSAHVSLERSTVQVLDEFTKRVHPVMWQMQEAVDRALSAPDNEAADATAKELAKEFARRREEMYRQTETNAVELLDAQREELTAETPWVDRLASVHAQGPELVNMLERLRQDAAVLRAGSLPEARRVEFLDRSMRDGGSEEPGTLRGNDAYVWAIREALLHSESVPTSELHRYLVDNPHRRPAVVVALSLRGERGDADALEEALGQLLKTWWPRELHGWCHVLAQLAAHDPGRAADMLPTERIPEEVQGTIAQCLRLATGEDRGLAVEPWREWLLSRR